MKGALGPYYHDFQCIDLNELDAWRALPQPPRRPRADSIAAWQMRLDDATDRAYLFSGKRELQYFDLKEEKWGKIATKWSGGDPKYWPYPSSELSEYSMAIVRGKLYIFGGTYYTNTIGNNLLIELDLETFLWRTLSGTTGPLVPDVTTPGPRRHAALWVDGKGERLWLLYGEADRAGAQDRGQPNGAKIGFGFDDCWSWDIAAESWRRERIAGNPPSPRSELACTYNTKLDKAFVFGGYCPNVPTVFPDQGLFQFTYYADTFMLDPAPANGSPPRWKQVLTRGFPTYRALSHLVSDPESGKVFLFGGYTNSDFVPNRKHPISRSFGDLWQLKLDVPGGFFEGVDIEEEARTAKAGPWKRCFSCGNAGQWKKCAGKCGGRAFFCNKQCQIDGWKEHKAMHNCSKK
ncbi:hypothetical protein FA95DRAFT_1564929 [Auriscalpium vulgare]|uniref:Uncharacterized protein n=1 Tax=Auriscalpium vulgare TaxID=40419 RepID=A0ACB8RCN4_9AGAM|nr:hypothetical protein FA95DRAFT_1564929 [Auriscalpium vulgare]